jgi:hypothetical protein
MRLIKSNIANEIVEFPYAASKLKSDNPNVSFPSDLTDVDLSSWNVYGVTTAEKPEYNHLTQTRLLGTPTYSGGSWSVGYTVTNKPEADAASSTRKKRDGLLEETDVFALSDRTLSDEMRQYRADLRTIPEQSGFPFDVTWPTKPVE